MKNDGFTLVEVIAVIAILGILTVLVSPALMEVRTLVLGNSLKSKISMIESAAIDYAHDYIMDIPSPVKKCECSSTDISNCKKSECINDCLTISVNALITRGYLVGDEENKEVLSDPLGSRPLNSYDVCIRFNNNDAYKREIISYIIGEVEGLSAIE